jgi:hypothetical protein
LVVLSIKGKSKNMDQARSEKEQEIVSELKTKKCGSE